MKQTALALKGATLVLSAIPGLAALRTGLGVPPGRAADLYGAFLMAGGVLAVFCAYRVLSRPRPEARSRATLESVVLLSISLLASVGYITVLDSTVVHHSRQFRGDPAPVETGLLFPLYPSARLRKMIEFSGGREEAITRNGLPVIQRELQNQGGRMALTHATLLSLLLLAQVTFVSSIVLATRRFGFAYPTSPQLAGRPEQLGYGRRQ